jgi:methylglyoxal synthase
MPNKIALVAHDNKKQELIDWANQHKSLLSQHALVATGTTGQKLQDEVGLDVFRFKSGPLGGDQQIGALIAEGELSALFFFWDPLNAQPHDPDVKALLRLCSVYNTPVACNVATANLLATSPHFLQDETVIV